MQFVIDIERLKNAVARVLPCIDSKPSIPVLNCILFELKDKLLYLTSSDINRSMRTHIALGDEVEFEEGAVCINGKYLASILSKMPGGELRFNVDSNYTLHLEQGTINYDILGICDLEFPKFLISEENEFQDIPASDLYRLLSSVLFACSNDESRLALCGIYLAKVGEQIISVSTDGRRLAIVEKCFEWDLKDFEALIPLKSISTMLKILKNHDDELLVRLGSYDKHISLEVRNTVFLSKQIEGNFPDYNKVVPAEDSYKYEFDLPVKPFCDAVERAQALINSAEGSVKLSFDGDSIQVSSEMNANAFSENVCEHECEKPLYLSLNPNFFMDGLRVVYEDTVKFRCIDKNSPINMSFGDWKYIIMPMRN